VLHHCNELNTTAHSFTCTLTPTSAPSDVCTHKRPSLPPDLCSDERKVHDTFHATDCMQLTWILRIRPLQCPLHFSLKELWKRVSSRGGIRTPLLLLYLTLATHSTKELYYHAKVTARKIAMNELISTC
jgi:hypothetical protein